MGETGATARAASAVIFGAGSVGRGFLGQLFSESGYEVVFVDVDGPLVEALAARGSYTLRLAGIDRTEALEIGPVRAVDGRDTERVAAEVARASLLATAVGARALAAIAAPLAAGLARRWEEGVTAPQAIILCENLHDAPERLSGFVREALPAPWRAVMAQRIGFVPAVIARMAPVPTPEQRAADIAAITAEPYKVLPVDREAFVGPIPRVVGMQAVSPFRAYTERKLYIHNAAHALLGYLGALEGYTYGYEALADAKIRRLLSRALDESSRALIAEHHFEPVAFQEHIDYLLLRFANRALSDPIERLARDPARKLAPDDRLVGAARLAERHGIVPEGLAWGIAAALRYRAAEDPHAAALQERLATEGLAAVLRAVCGIEAQEPLGQRVIAAYEALGA